MKVIVDAMGGDHAPAAILEGCVIALKQNPAASDHTDRQQRRDFGRACEP